MCGLLYRDALDVTDVGLALLPQYWKCGYAYEAAAAVMEYGRSSLGLDEIVALTSEENTASINLAKKFGMKFDRIVKMSDDDPGTALYS